MRSFIVFATTVALSSSAVAEQRRCTPDEIEADRQWHTSTCKGADRDRPRTVSDRAYTPEQLRLAASIGAVVGLVRLCTVVPMPSVTIQQAVRGAGLRDRDFLDASTAFRRRVQDQADAVVMMTAVQKQMGTRDSDIAANACKALVENYGPRGSIHPGLVPAR